MILPGNNKNDRGEQIDTKSNQWFGATVASGGIDGPVVVSYQEQQEHQIIRTIDHDNLQSIKPQPAKEILKAFRNDLKDLWRQIRDSQKLQQSETIKIPFNGEFIRSTFRYFYRSSYQSSYHSRNNITNPFVTGQCRRIFLYLHDLNWLQLYSSHSLDRSVGLITNRSIDGQILHMHQRIIKCTEECAVDE